MNKFFSSKMKKIIFLFGILILLGTGIFFQKNQDPPAQSEKVNTISNPHPLQITEMRKKNYPGSEITIEEELEPGSNYRQFLASYQSEGLKINALLTVPEGETPSGGWPAIIFNHGYIPPAQYTTTGRYVAYVDAFASNGYVVIKADFRGHGSSEGNPEGGYYSPAYTTDVLNALSSIKKYPGVNPDKIGMWGHSMGGSLTLRSMVVSKDIKAGVIWAGVVASYEDMIKNWRRARPFMLSEREQAFRRPGRQALIDKYGDPDKNPEFWKSISPIAFTRDISGPLQLHHGTADEEVPLLFSERLNEAMKAAGKEVELFTYEGDGHNISGNLSLALNRSVEFFNKHLKK
jgi:dipeptidyl aminopeptidase/acylaminoacyl peptidase